MKTAPGVIFFKYAYAEEFKGIHVFDCGQPNHLHKLLRGYDRKIPITAAKKMTSGNFVPNKSFHLST